MRTFGIIVGTIVLIIGGFIAWWASQTPTYVYRFRLVIEADAGGALRSGASVIEVRTTHYKVGSAETAGVRSHVRGEAAFVDLGDGKHVIATLGFGPNGSEDKIDMLVNIVFLPSHPGLRVDGLPKLTGTAPLTGNLIPTLVTFTDLNDPKTARVVRPEEFEQVFGPGVRFKRAFVEMTSDPITRGIEKKMPMLVTHRDLLRRIIDDMPPRFQPHFHYFTRI